MSIQIAELICNVSVTLHEQEEEHAALPSPPVSAPVAAATMPAFEYLPPLEFAVHGSNADAEVPSGDVVEESSAPETFTAPKADLAKIDPHVLTERVYRLLRDELAIALERE